jgi:small ligand-binding sensory domain FIST
MTGFAYAHACGPDWERCVAACAERIGRPQGGLGFVYFTEALAPHAERIVSELRRRTGIEDWVGTVGTGVLATGVEYQDEPALVAMVAAIGPQDYRVFSGRSRLPAPGDAAPAHFAVVHADPQAPDVAGLVADMASKLDSGYLVGGLSSARGATLQVANDVVAGGLSGVVLASGVQVSTRLTQGCAALPAPGSASGVGRYRVTACEENVIFELDGRPALDVFRDAAGELLARDLRRAAAFVLAGLPVRGSDTGDYLVRNLVGIDVSNKLIAIGDTVAQGDEIIFCKRDAASAGEDLRRMLGELRERGPAPRGALYFSCVARGEHMFGRRGAEMELVREALGELPLVGFFCSGEISHDRLYGYTGVMTIFH